MHDDGVLDVAVGEHDLLDLVLATDFCELRFIEDRNAAGIMGPCKLGWIPTSGNPGDLCCGEGNDIAALLVAVDHVEVMKVPTGRAHDNDNPTLAACCHDERSLDPSP